MNKFVELRVGSHFYLEIVRCGFLYGIELNIMHVITLLKMKLYTICLYLDWNLYYISSLLGTLNQSGNRGLTNFNSFDVKDEKKKKKTAQSLSRLGRLGKLWKKSSSYLIIWKEIEIHESKLLNWVILNLN